MIEAIIVLAMMGFKHLVKIVLGVFGRLKLKIQRILEMLCSEFEKSLHYIRFCASPLSQDHSHLRDER
jgi:hypothetical protein